MTALKRDPDFAYKNAPITEAVIGIDIVRPEALPIKTIDALVERLRPEFGKVQELRNLTTQVALGQATGTSMMQERVGYLLESKDGFERVRFLQTAFSYHRLPPYERWSVFADNAKRYWSEYRALLGDARVRRVGVRYLNKIEVAGVISNLADYLLVSPRVPQEAIGTPKEQFLQVVSDLDQLKTISILNYAATLNERPGYVTAILDIDVSRETELPANDDRLWAILGDLRNRKNEIFELSLTKYAKEKFNE